MGHVQNAVLLVALPLFFYGLSPAQTPISYYPHAVGNLWQYRSLFTNEITGTYRIERDSLGANGSVFFWLEGSFPSQYTEIDTQHQVWGAGRGALLYRLGAKEGETWRVNVFPPPFDSAKVVDIYLGTVFGQPVNVKEIVYWRRFELGNSLWYGTHYLATGFGIVREDIEPSDVWYLAGAIIHSVQWGIIVDVAETVEQPTTVMLKQNYPNPFNPSTTINFVVPRRSRVKLTVFDVLGRQMKTLLDGTKEAGSHSIHFDASSLSSGVYFYRLETAGTVTTKKMIVQK